MAELESIELSVPLHICEQYWALCLSWWGGDRLASRNPDHSSGHQDKHKAPTRLHVHPLSLQDAATRTSTRPPPVSTSTPCPYRTQADLPNHCPIRSATFIRAGSCCWCGTVTCI